MAGRRTFRTLTSSQQSGIKSRHINTHITTIPNTQYTSNQYTTHYSVHQNLVHNHQENLLYLCDTGICHSVWVTVWSVDQTEKLK